MANQRLIPVGAREEYVPISSGHVRTLVGVHSGGGLPILLIHGGASDNSAISWNRLVHPLSLDRLVIAPDLPGYGYTEGVPVAATAAGMADHLRELLRESGVDRVVVCGVSMGGEVALQFALRHPEVCEALIAISPGGLIERFKNPAAHFSAWAVTKLPLPLLKAISSLASRQPKTMMTRIVKDIDTIPGEVIDEFSRESRRSNAGDAYARYNKHAIGPLSMRNWLIPSVEQIEIPAMIVHGADDLLVDPRGSQRAAQLMPQAKLILLPECGHWAQLEAHDLVLAEARTFLADLQL